MSLPAFRTDPKRSRRITWWACVIGYAVTLLAMPLAAAALHQLAILLLKGTGITRTAIGPLLQYGEQVVQFLGFSIIAAYVGAIVSVPVVIWARLKGWFGWGTAMLTGVAVAFLVLGLFFGFAADRILTDLAVPSAILGLSFWITVRLIHPGAFEK